MKHNAVCSVERDGQDLLRSFRAKGGSIMRDFRYQF